MKFNPKTFAEKIESKYITSYGAEIGEIICSIFNREKNKNYFDELLINIKNHNFFDIEKVGIDSLDKIDFELTKKALVSSIIKECKYNDHFMTWNEGLTFANIFLNEFNDIEEIYTNSHWETFNDNRYKDELDMTGWTNFSYDYWYDYGFIIVTPKKIGLIWFGDDS